MMEVVGDALYTLMMAVVGGCFVYSGLEHAGITLVHEVFLLRCEQVGKVTPVSKARVAQKNGQWAWGYGHSRQGTAPAKPR